VLPPEAIHNARLLNLSLSRGVVLLFVLAASAWAVDPNRQITQYAHTAWRTQDGLLDKPSALTQTADGYIWVGTSSGLMRFDGVTFRHWTPPGGEPFPFVADLLGARDGSLWIGTARGLFLLKDGVLSGYNAKRGAPGISAIIEDRNGTIWVTRYRINDGQGPLCRVTGATLQCFGESDGIGSGYGLGLAEDSKGNIWFGCQALCRWAPGSSQVYFKEQFKNKSSNGVSRVAMGPSDTVWATLEGTGPKMGVQYYSGGKWSSYVVPGFDGRTILSEVLLFDRNQTLWVGTTSAGLYHIHDGFADHYGSAQGLSGNLVETIFEDKEGNIWITTDRGIDLFRDFAVATFSDNEGLIGTTVRSIMASTDGSVWVANEGSLDIIRSDGVSAVRAGHGLPGHNVKALFKDSAGRMWLGIDNKIMTYNQGRFLEVRDSPARLVESAASFAEDVEGNVWVLDHHESGEARLFRIRGDRIEENIRVDKLFPRPRAIAADRGGGIWVYYSGSNIARYRDGRAEAAVSLVGRPDQVLIPSSFFVDSHNVAWAATNKGLYRIKDGAVTLMDSRNGLPCSMVFSMIEDNDGAYWLYTRCGLVKISKSDFASWVKSPDGKVPVRVYDALDGVQADISPESYTPVVTKSPDGHLWFAGDTDVQTVDPGRNHTNATPPPVHIEELLADHKNYADLKNLKLPPLSGELEINYTALSFSIPRRVRFRYELEGHDQQWQDAGTRRQAFYNDLGPGHYRFRVIACNNDGVWNEEGATLDFSVAPAWYQTIWFRISCVGGFVLLLWALYQLRLQQLERQFGMQVEARVNERTRIARELHDTLLQSFQGLMLRFQTVGEMLPARPVDAKKALEGALDRADEAISEGRDAITDIRASSLASRDLEKSITALMTNLSEELAAGNGRSTTFRVVVEGAPRAVRPTLQDEIHRIARESLRNAFRHAQAGHIETEITYGESLRLRFRDDGTGIDPSVVEHGGRSGHWGLPGIRERAKQIGAQLAIWSELGAGTEVELSIPGSIAYEASPTRPRFRLFRKRTEQDHEHRS
jgi:signal transduction histidine kinase/ligand-binding sensor domain-containing protein